MIAKSKAYIDDNQLKQEYEEEKINDNNRQAIKTCTIIRATDNNTL